MSQPAGDPAALVSDPPLGESDTSVRGSMQIDNSTGKKQETLRRGGWAFGPWASHYIYARARVSCELVEMLSSRR